MTRDDKGRFAQGHEKLGGRKTRAIEEQYLQSFKNAVTPDDWTAIIKKAISQAKYGDATARKFIADYLIGAPTQKTETEIKGTVTLVWDLPQPKKSE